MNDDFISRQTAIDAICNDWCGTSNADCKNPFDHATDDYYFCDGCGDVELIKTLPSADAVEVVRCKDCKWCDWYTAVDGKQYCYCMETGASARTETDYCSYGERQDGEQNG